ncbi:hypothetical protein [Kribbella voronezhensis]|nr:hypothetical protein [Kribbella voronezhensis]
MIKRFLTVAAAAGLLAGLFVGAPGTATAGDKPGGLCTVCWQM